MGLEFTNLEYRTFQNDAMANLSADMQVAHFIQSLKGKVAKWQILAPTSATRVLYFEMENGAAAEQVTGVQESLRNLAKDVSKTKIKRS